MGIHCAYSKVRLFKFRFYEENRMFRLNIPNATPSVAWARENRKGISRVTYSEAQETLYFEILSPGQRMEDIVDRSLALGTWGQTHTRLYGWY